MAHAPSQFAELNPYASPREAVLAELPLLPPELWSELRLGVVAVEKRAMTRRLIVSGSVEADIYYDGWPAGEAVHVNGRLCQRGSALQWHLVNPRIDFEIEGPGFKLPAAVLVRAGWSLWPLVRVREFRLLVADRLLYEEA